MDTPTLELTRRFKPFNDDARVNDLWVFLNTRETIIRFETATYLKRPAIEAITNTLMQDFGDLFNPDIQKDSKKRDDYKRLAGHLVRRVMEMHAGVSTRSRRTSALPQMAALSTGDLEPKAHRNTRSSTRLGKIAEVEGNCRYIGCNNESEYCHG